MTPGPIPPPPPRESRDLRRHPLLHDRPEDERWWTVQDEALWIATDEWEEQRNLAEAEALSSTDIWAVIRCGASNGKCRRILGRVVNTTQGLVLIAVDHTDGFRRFEPGFEPDDSTVSDQPPRWLRPRPGSAGPIEAALWCPNHDGAHVGVDLQELIKKPRKDALLLASARRSEIQ